MISDENGNSFEVEVDITKSPLTEQFHRLTDFLNVAPTSILTGAFCPFRSDEWDDFSSEMKDIGFEIGKKFWYSAIRKNEINLIITLGHGKILNETLTMPIAEEFDAKLDKEIILGNNWCCLRRYIGENIKIIQLPHLSRFRIFDSQNTYINEIEDIFSIV